MAQSVKPSRVGDISPSEAIAKKRDASLPVAPPVVRVASVEPVNGLADDQLIALHEVTRALAREKSLLAALRLITEKARQLTSSSSTALCRVDETRQNLDFVAVAGRGAIEMVGQRVRVTDALPGQTAATGEQLLAYNPLGNSAADDRGKHPYPKPATDDEAFIASGGVRSAAIVPIFVNGVSVGSLGSIDRVDGESFTGTDLLILHILASSAAVAYQQEGLRADRLAAVRERDILQEAARATSQTLNVTDILDGMLSTLSRSVDMCAAFVFLLNDDRTHLFIAADHGLTDEEREIQLLADGPLASAALSNSRSFIITDPASDPRYEDIFPAERPQPLSWMVAPLVSREKVMGLIVVASLARNAYTPDDLQLLNAVAAPAAVAMENAELYEEATRRTEEATAIYELSQAVNTNLNLTRMLNFVADSVLNLLHVDKFALFLHDPVTQTLEIKVARNIRRQTVAQSRPDRVNGGIAWWVYEYETPTAVQNVAADHRNRSLPIEGEGVASLVSVPIQAGDDVIGVIHAMSSRRRSFTVGEMELLYTIANQVGVAIANIQIIEDTRQKTDELRRASRRVARALGSSGDPALTAQTIVDLAGEVMRADRCVLYAVDPASGELTFRAAHGMRVTTPPDMRRADKELTAQWVQRKVRSMVIDNAASDPRFVPPASLVQQVGRSGAYVGMPLKIGSGLVGVLEVYSREPRQFPTDELRQYVAFAAQGAVALQNAILIEQAGRRKQDLDLLVKVAERIAEGERDMLAFDILTLLSTTLGCDSGLLLVKPAARNRSSRETVSGTALTDQAHRDALSGISRWSGEHGAVVRHDPSPLGESPQPWASLLEAFPETTAKPILAAPMLGGALCLSRPPIAAPFDASDVQIIETVARVLGPAALKTIA